MQKVYHLWGLLFISFVLPSSLSAQGFTSSETYQKIQNQPYSAKGLPLEADVFKRNKKPVGLTFQPTISAIFTTQPEGRKSSAFTSVNVTRSPYVQGGAWKGTTTSVGANESELKVTKRRLGIGGGNTPGNPNDTDTENGSGSSGGIGGGGIGGGNTPGNPNDTNSDGNGGESGGGIGGGGIGGGEIPGNPNDLPVGHLPIWLMLLLAIGYITFRRKSAGEI